MLLRVFIMFFAHLLSGCHESGDSADYASHIKQHRLSRVIASAKMDSSVSIQVDSSGNPNVNVGGLFITQTEFIKSEIIYEPLRRKIIWLQNEYSNGVNQVFVDGQRLTDTNTLKRALSLLGDHFYWIEPGEQSSRLCMQNIDALAYADSCVSVDFSVQDLIEGDMIRLIGINHSTNRYQVASLLPTSLIQAEVMISENSLSASCHSCVDKTILEVSGYGQLMYVNWALRWFYGAQYGEPYSFGNDFMGRLSNNQSYRLLSLENLYKITGDESFKQLYSGAVENLLKLSEADENGLICSKKYSLSRESCIPYMVDSALIFRSILSGLALLTDDQRDRAKALAVRMVQFYERYWFEDHYRFPTHHDILFDGVYLPFNQQNMLGIVLLQLYELTGEEQYLLKASILYRTFVTELTVLPDGGHAWHYWPQRFYAGWSAGTLDSINAPEREPSTDSLYEDSLHAIINLEFMEYYSVVTGEDIAVDPNKIVSRMRVTGLGYSRFISGDTDYQPASFELIPQGRFAFYGDVSSVYQKNVVLAQPDFDTQQLYSTYSSLARGSGMSEIRIVDTSTGATVFYCYQKNDECIGMLSSFWRARH